MPQELKLDKITTDLLEEFKGLMLVRMAENFKKKGDSWTKLSPLQLEDMLMMKNIEWIKERREQTPDSYRDLLIDMANYCMMIYFQWQPIIDEVQKELISQAQGDYDVMQQEMEMQAAEQAREQENKAELRFIRGRLRFVPIGQPLELANATFPSMLCIYRRNMDGILPTTLYSGYGKHE